MVTTEPVLFGTVVCAGTGRNRLRIPSCYHTEIKEGGRGTATAVALPAQPFETDDEQINESVQDEPPA